MRTGWLDFSLSDVGDIALVRQQLSRQWTGHAVAAPQAARAGRRLDTVSPFRARRHSETRTGDPGFAAEYVLRARLRRENYDAPLSDPG
jgi:hypothetical protein